MKKSYTILMALMFAFATQKNVAQTDYEDGIFILNEGGAGGNNAALSFLDHAGNLTNDVFSTANPGMGLGDTAQGMGFYQDLGFIVSNISNEVNVMSMSDLSHIATISSGIENPRYIEFDNDLAYVTNWGDAGDTTDDYVAVINITTNEVIDNIPVAEGPEEIIKKNGMLYVAHQGGYGFGNTVSVIDLTNYNVTSINVGDVPNSLEVDDNYLYVLCGGNPSWSETETEGKLFRIDLTDYTVMDEYNFATGEHPHFLELENGVAYYMLSGNIYEFDFSATTLPTTEFINTSSENIQIPYAMAYIDNTFYVADAVDYVSAGDVYTYDAAGTFQNTYSVSILPNGFYKYENSSLSVPVQEQLQLTLYPNPASERIFLDTEERVHLSIYDIHGRMVKEETYTANGVNINDLESGIYLVNLQQQSNQKTIKLIVK